MSMALCACYIRRCASSSFSPQPSLPVSSPLSRFRSNTKTQLRSRRALTPRSLHADYTAVLERRSGRAPGTGGRSRRQGPAPLGPPHNSHEAATAAYHATANKPAAHDTFRTATGRKHILFYLLLYLQRAHVLNIYMFDADVYTGEHVQKAIAEFHKHDPTPGGHATGSAGKGHPKAFRNDPNRSTGDRPFPNAVGHGAIKEFPLFSGGKGYHQGNTGNARIIMQENGHGGVYLILLY